MSGIFGVASKTSCTLDVFFGTDYHSHLGTRRGGMAVWENGYFKKSIHNITNTPFRTKFDKDLEELEGTMGIGCISDQESQPLVIHSHMGTYAITTVGKINNADDLVKVCFDNGLAHFYESSDGMVNPTELCAALINQKDSIVEGIRYAQRVIDGSMTMMILTGEGIYCARDYYGRTPLIIGKKDGAYCATFETTAYMNLGYTHVKDLGPAEIGLMTPDSYTMLVEPRDEMKMCSFLWVYYGYPTSSYEGINVELMRYRCGEMLAARDNVKPNYVAGVPDSGIAHAVGYANASGIPFARPFIKYTPTWPRSFMPTSQAQRNLIAHMKLIPVMELVQDQSILLIDDSIVRGTQLRETTEFLYKSGAKEVHVRPACPPLLYGCKYLNFSRSNSELDLITRRIILEREGENAEASLKDYANPDHPKYQEMLDEICKQLNFTSLRYHRLDDMIDSIALPKEKLCTYCWDGKE